MYIANPKVATKYNQKMYRGETWNAKNILQRKKKTSPSLFTIQHIIANTLLNTFGISDHQMCGGFLPPRNTYKHHVVSYSGLSSYASRQ